MCINLVEAVGLIAEKKTQKMQKKMHLGSQKHLYSLKPIYGL